MAVAGVTISRRWNRIVYRSQDQEWLPPAILADWRDAVMIKQHKLAREPIADRVLQLVQSPRSWGRAVAAAFTSMPMIRPATTIDARAIPAHGSSRDPRRSDAGI
jgi:hypothetical protein